MCEYEITADPAATVPTPPNLAKAQAVPLGHGMRDRTSTDSSSATGHTAAPSSAATLGVHPRPAPVGAIRDASTLAATDTKLPKTNAVQATSFPPRSPGGPGRSGGE